jgi:hypothetical protein
MEEIERSRSGGLARKAVAGVVLLVAGWILLKIVLGFVATIAWIFVVVAAIAAVIWALRVL